MIKWVPHQKMLVDCLTKDSLKRSNGALTQFLKSGWLSLVDVAQELEHRKNDVAYRRRSLKASSDRLMKECQEDLHLFCDGVLSTLIGGYCENSAVVTNLLS